MVKKSNLKDENLRLFFTFSFTLQREYDIIDLSNKAIGETIMTNYEMLQTLLNDSDLQTLMIDHLECGKIELLLKEDESNRYLLDVKVIDVFDDVFNEVEILRYVETFKIELDDRGYVRYFFIRVIDHVTVGEALASAKLGEIIEDFLRSKLN